MSTKPADRPAPVRSTNSTATNAEIFKAFIANKKILVADTSNVSRSNLAANFIHLGAKTAQITLAMSYETAEQEITLHKPEIVICEYDLGKKCGLDLLQKQRLLRPESKECLFILVTGNTSQTAVARAAEEDIDSYILKPFTADILRQSILRAAVLKKNPGKYLETVEKGKIALKDGKTDEALASFKEAKKLDPKPSLACFYEGQAELMKSILDAAEDSYEQGLIHNKIHYKCLVGLYEVLMSLKRYDQAYDVVKKISHYFPANPQRLTAVLRLAMMTKSYADVERYYQIFSKIDDRNEDIIKHICAALVVCGKYYLQQNHATRALELFQKASNAGPGRTNVLREVILALVSSGMIQQASEFLKKFPPETQSGASYLALDLLVKDAQLAPSLTIQIGRQLLDKGLQDPLIYLVLIRRTAEAGLRAAVEELVLNASKLWPEQKDQFAVPATSKIV